MAQSNSVHNICGLQVHFGRQPFGPQFSLMSKVIAAIRSPANALLESPTGTGKTLALLAASLAAQHFYRQQQEAAKAVNLAIRHIEKLSSGALKGVPGMDCTPLALLPENEPPTIYFFSRTHSQLSQVVREYGKLNAYTQERGAALAGPNKDLLRELVDQVLSGPSGEHLNARLTLLQLPQGVSPVDVISSLAEIACAPRLPPPSMSLLASRSRACINDDALAGELGKLRLAEGSGQSATRKKRKSGGAGSGLTSLQAQGQLSGRGVDDACVALMAARMCRQVQHCRTCV